MNLIPEETEFQCICDRIVGHDAATGYPRVDTSYEKWAYLYDQNVSEVGEG